MTAIEELKKDGRREWYTGGGRVGERRKSGGENRAGLKHDWHLVGIDNGGERVGAILNPEGVVSNDEFLDSGGFNAAVIDRAKNVLGRAEADEVDANVAKESGVGVGREGSSSRRRGQILFFFREGEGLVVCRRGSNERGRGRDRLRVAGRRSSRRDGQWGLTEKPE